MSLAADPDDITELLRKTAVGDRRAEQALIPLVYTQLRRLAAQHLRRERTDHSLQPTALVHEAYLRLVGGSEVDWQDRSHFFRVAAVLMRRILVDHARSRKANKRAGIRIPLEDFLLPSEEQSEFLLDLDRVLTRLEKLDSRQAQVVEMRFFAGLSEDEIASALGVSSRTIKREWKMAKAWLRAELIPSSLQPREVS